MACIVKIPAPLQSYTDGEKSLEVEGDTVGAVLAELGMRHKGLTDRICDPAGGVRSFVNIYLNGRDVRQLKGLETKVSAGDEVLLVPAIAGG